MFGNIKTYCLVYKLHNIDDVIIITFVKQTDIPCKASIGLLIHRMYNTNQNEIFILIIFGKMLFTRDPIVDHKRHSRISHSQG